MTWRAKFTSSHGNGILNLAVLRARRGDGSSLQKRTLYEAANAQEPFWAVKFGVKFDKAASFCERANLSNLQKAACKAKIGHKAQAVAPTNLSAIFKFGGKIYEQANAVNLNK
ncbi:hypothetical protein CAMRE0001_1662 [Campylobacter rectus RM3267]|uniref:Uncharacterized protein n=2 Tax=Campylobacter rectus TaxID=203 RepID=A0A6G5QP87_CAMRE|nr:hypothetical protein [Campylobacter rectus]EEF14906.1 hypothetical protein CAMRE0001_1662 [Campylobacter rectus RM3267]QCD47404.1 hypothetical protein CRECT_1778 [Campylobacter rectus]UEB48100.1 hypothetical protein LK437_01890 [Campylobacter rectus]